MPSTDLADDSEPVLDWMEEQEITHLAFHFDLDVLDPAHFSLFHSTILTYRTIDTMGSVTVVGRGGRVSCLVQRIG